MRSYQFRLKWVSLLFLLASLVACSPQTGDAGLSSTSHSLPSRITPLAPTQTIPTLSPTVVAPTASPTADGDQQVLKSYHTILMLERADDLLIAYVQKEHTGEVSINDADERAPYLQAFSVALDDFNHTMPPTPSILNHAWKTVSTATEQFLNVYNAVDQGQAVSSRDLNSMRLLRQLMKNYEDYSVSYLHARGKDSSFFASEHQAVEMHFLKSYGDQPIPSLSPANETPTPAQ